MKLIYTAKTVILEGLLEDILMKYVGEGKLISDQTYDEIRRVSKNKTSNVIWLIRRIADNLILQEDLYKYSQYFQTFEKYKSEFPIKDLNQIKTRGDLDNFISKAIDIDDQLKKITNDGTNRAKDFVGLNGIKELEGVGIKYLGIADNYQIFEVPNELKDSENAWKIYKKHLAKCSGREEGEGVNICTMAGFNHFTHYLTDYGGSYFVIFNQSDSDSPYQINFESGQFKNRKDIEIL